MLETCGCHVLMLEYRGYGHSEGTPSESGLLLDAQAALKVLRQEPALSAGGADAGLGEVGEATEGYTGDIFLFGRSLGGAVAIALARRQDVRQRRRL